MDDSDAPILDFANATFNDGRNTTVRRGSRWHGVARARLRLPDGSLSSPVALQTELKRFDALTAQDLRFEHDPRCRTVQGLLAELRRHYPGFDPDDVVTLCHFDVEGGSTAAAGSSCV